jgi:beta-mannosidase
MHFYGQPDNYSTNCWDVSMYPRARFITEIGWESWPSFVTLGPMLSPQDYGFNASVPVLRQQHPPGQAEITKRVHDNWRWPDRAASNTAVGYGDELWMTQVAAAQCLTTAVEFWRGTSDELKNTTYDRSPLGWAMLGGNAGILYWQADDTWVGPSWSTIEVGGRLKVGALPPCIRSPPIRTNAFQFH